MVSGISTTRSQFDVNASGSFLIWTALRNGVSAEAQRRQLADAETG